MIFDPNFHEALMYEDDEINEEGTIISIIQEGYQIDDKLLRPARVVVAKKPEMQTEQEQEE